MASEEHDVASLLEKLKRSYEDESLPVRQRWRKTDLETYVVLSVFRVQDRRWDYLIEVRYYWRDKQIKNAVCNNVPAEEFPGLNATQETTVESRQAEVLNEYTVIAQNTCFFGTESIEEIRQYKNGSTKMWLFQRGRWEEEMY